MIVTLRTDKPEAELGLYDGQEELAFTAWHAHRQLAETIHKKLKSLLDENKADFKDITGVVVFEGPGSYTGLRIGFSVANSLAYGQDVPIVAAGGDEWKQNGLKEIARSPARNYVSPVYGGVAHTTKQKK